MKIVCFSSCPKAKVTVGAGDTQVFPEHSPELHVRSALFDVLFCREFCQWFGVKGNWVQHTMTQRLHNSIYKWM